MQGTARVYGFDEGKIQRYQAAPQKEPWVPLEGVNSREMKVTINRPHHPVISRVS